MTIKFHVFGMDSTRTVKVEETGFLGGKHEYTKQVPAFSGTDEMYAGVAEFATSLGDRLITISGTPWGENNEGYLHGHVVVWYHEVLPPKEEAPEAEGLLESVLAYLNNVADHGLGGIEFVKHPGVMPLAHKLHAMWQANVVAKNMVRLEPPIVEPLEDVVHQFQLGDEVRILPGHPEDRFISWTGKVVSLTSWYEPERLEVELEKDENHRLTTRVEPKYLEFKSPF